jgi:archaellum component FlaC
LQDRKLALENKKNELSEVKLEFSNLKESEQEKVTKIDRLTGLYKEVNMMYKRSSADLHLLSTRCHNLNNENQKLVAIPKAVKSNKFVTMSKADYVAYTVQLVNAQVDAGNSVMTVLGNKLKTPLYSSND